MQVTNVGHSVKHFYRRATNCTLGDQRRKVTLGATLSRALFLCSRHRLKDPKSLSCQHLGKGRIFLSED